MKVPSWIHVKYRHGSTMDPWRMHAWYRQGSTIDPWRMHAGQCQRTTENTVLWQCQRTTYTDRGSLAVPKDHREHGPPLWRMRAYLFFIIINWRNSTNCFVWYQIYWTLTPSSLEVRRSSLVGLTNRNGWYWTRWLENMARHCEECRYILFSSL